MTSSRTSGGDPARTLALLWRIDERPRRGPQRGLDLDAVVAAATAIADREGLAAVTMRSLAKDLGVSAMTLYTYVPGKDELVDVMLDAAYQQMSRPDTTGQPWRQRLTAVADANRALYLTHPWASTVSIVTGMPAEAIFSTMRTIRVSRLARACSISLTRSGFSGSMR